MNDEPLCRDKMEHMLHRSWRKLEMKVKQKISINELVQKKSFDSEECPI
jgi:hypothetical protein